jgi:ribonuclease VapC
LSDAGYLLDASALLCLIYGEPGADEVKGYMPDAAITAVNYSEVVTKLQERGASDEEIDAGLATLKIAVLPFDTDHAVSAGKLRKATRHRGLSLGDRACLAVAMQRSAVAVTTDRNWLEVDVGAKIQAVR